MIGWQLLAVVVFHFVVVLMDGQEKIVQNQFAQQDVVLQEAVVLFQGCVNVNLVGQEIFAQINFVIKVVFMVN